MGVLSPPSNPCSIPLSLPHTLALSIALSNALSLPLSPLVCVVSVCVPLAEGGINRWIDSQVFQSLQWGRSESGHSGAAVGMSAPCPPLNGTKGDTTSTQQMGNVPP